MKRRAILFCWTMMALIVLTLWGSELSAGEVVIPGKVVTGFNRYLGQPHAEFGGLGLLGFPDALAPQFHGAAAQLVLFVDGRALAPSLVRHPPGP